MSTENKQEHTTSEATPLPPANGSERPSAKTIRFVEQWLWSSEYCETSGQPWTGDYVRDAARMIEDALARSPNDPSSATAATKRPD